MPAEVAAAQAESWQQQQQQMEQQLNWGEAPGCGQAPTVFTSVADRQGRLWGWEGGRSCRFVWEP